jgi:ferric-dicitrate binding protein FerR (iron transport regulator)
VLARYLAGESDRGERASVEAWAAASVERREYLAALARSWSRGRAGAASAELRETDAAWVALRNRLGDYDSALHAGEGLDGGRDAASLQRDAASRRGFVIPGAGSAGVRRRWLHAVAAALIVGTGAGALHYFEAERVEAAARSVARAPMREVVTGVGERARVRLGDGSTIVLAARSRLGIPADFGVNAREVETEGEAYFEVAHDSTLPFIVRTRGARTVDVGTTFVVRAYPEDPEVTVVVSEGSVMLGADASADSTGARASTLLRPGEKGSLRSGARVPSVTAVNAASYTGWIDGRLAFDNAPLPQVIADLGRWHTTRIVLADSSLAHETVTASLAADSFDDALRTLTTVLALRVERRGDSVLLHRRRGSHL